MLEAAEGQAKLSIKNDIPRYIISKLGLNQDASTGMEGEGGRGGGRGRGEGWGNNGMRFTVNMWGVIALCHMLIDKALSMQ